MLVERLEDGGDKCCLVLEGSALLFDKGVPDEVDLQLENVLWACAWSWSRHFRPLADLRLFFKLSRVFVFTVGVLAL